MTHSYDYSDEQLLLNHISELETQITKLESTAKILRAAQSNIIIENENNIESVVLLEGDNEDLSQQLFDAIRYNKALTNRINKENNSLKRLDYGMQITKLQDNMTRLNETTVKLRKKLSTQKTKVQECDAKLKQLNEFRNKRM
jgi:hypothetical protein